MALLVTLKVVLPAALAELCTGVNVPSVAGVGRAAVADLESTWVQQVVPNWITTWLSRTDLPMSRISPVPFFRFPNEVG